MTSGELAEATGTDERYAREWLEQQAVAGILEVDDVEAAPRSAATRLPAGHAEVLVDRDSLSHVTPMARYGVSFAQTLPAIEDAFRTAAASPGRTSAGWRATGRETSTGRSTRICSAPSGCPAITDVHERLAADPPARVADVACGAGWSSIAIARPTRR